MTDIINEDEFPEYERPNKSLMKREAQACLDLAQKLMELHPSKWLELGFSQSILDELQTLYDIKQHGAKKRQLKLVAKLLRHADLTLATQVVENEDKRGAEQSAVFHRVESWRDRLLTDAQALTGFLKEFPGSDVQYLRQMIRNAQHEVAKGKSPKSSKLLFKYLRGLMS